MNLDFELLLHACSPPSEERSEHLTRLLEQLTDWTGVIELAMAHEILPLFSHALLTSHAWQIPDALSDALQTRLTRHLAQAEDKTQGLLQLIERLESQAVPVAPFKGPLLAQQAYGDYRLRSFLDIDILLQESDIDQTLTSMQNMGYQHQAGLDQRQLRALRRYAGQYILFHGQDGLALEPHWWFTPITLCIGLDYTEIWQRMTETELAGQRVLGLSAEDAMIMQLVHGAKEQWLNLKQVCDLVWLLENGPTINWDKLRQIAEKAGCIRITRLGLVLADKLFSPPMPVDIRTWAHTDPLAKDLANQAVSRLKQSQPGIPNLYQRSRYFIDIRERRRDALCYLWLTTITPRAPHIGMLPLPEHLTWMYTGLKLADDLLQLVRRSIRKVIPNKT